MNLAWAFFKRDAITAVSYRVSFAVQLLGNLLVLGRIGPRTVIGLPGCARSPRRNGLDLVIEAVAAGQPPEGADIARLGVGGLLEESGRPVPWGWAD